MIKYELIENKYNKYQGVVFSSLKCGDFTVIGRPVAYPDRYVIEFCRTGFQKIIRTDIMKTKMVKDPYAPCVRGVGYIGDYIGFVKDNPLYQTWMCILDRATDEHHKSIHPTYKTCSISEDWLCFSTFEKEVKLLVGYDDKLSYKDIEFEIDKDILFHGNKEYSLEKCIWIPRNLNLFFTNINSKNTSGYEGVSKQGDKYIAKVSMRGERIKLGTFTTKLEAYEEYSKQKLTILNTYLLEEFSFISEYIKEAMRNKLKMQYKEKIGFI